MLALRCGTCRYRRISCDGAQPACSPCRAVGFNCSGYDYAASPGANGGDRRGVLTRLHPQSVPDMLEGGIAYDPMPQLYNEAQIIFDGVHYCE
ncbi:hypothetical protein PFICI_13954 [Pestalotiopsis fici W106-1]|uniref:Zn(2)-C6 fungal-type domain-containing protein n=1 Tax=Pestalotiopsis fici (strain W106-1 / CGMCC3.15140) TaxID=1229662 RepID=W3WJN6_PESFW|nr:uncharacterized protein PFICI_13954 [Pestalotiopsis fici W106-1]ETS74088.1 hypothetical protein PFICI_13954 [Pestalotiopsis fici W106-1]